MLTVTDGRTYKHKFLKSLALKKALLQQQKMENIDANNFFSCNLLDQYEIFFKIRNSNKFRFKSIEKNVQLKLNFKLKTIKILQTKS